MVLRNIFPIFLFAIFFCLGEATHADTCVPPPDGMVSWWMADGNADDFLGNNPGTLEGGTSFVPGKVLTAFELDGVDGYVNVPDSASLDVITSAITVDMWMKPELPVYYGAWMFGRRNPLSFNAFGISLSQDGHYIVSVGSGAGNSTLWSADSIVQFGTLQHVAATADTVTGEVKLYVDGVEVPFSFVQGSAVISPPLRNADYNFIGRRQSSSTGEGEAGAAHYKGLIDEVEIFDRALSAGEIQAIYLAGTAGKCRGTVPLDHFKCYKAKDDEGFFDELVVTLSDQFEEKNMVVKEPRLLCNPVDKNGEGINDPVSHLVCYETYKDDDEPDFEKREVVIEDQFGELLMLVEEPEFLCAPALKTDLGPEKDDDGDD